MSLSDGNSRPLGDVLHACNSRQQSALNELVMKIQCKKIQKEAMELRKQEQIDMNPVKKYQSHRSKIVDNLKSKDYWPEEICHPDDYRSFYWTNDLSFCGFATAEH
jgi:hypothetical protein